MTHRFHYNDLFYFVATDEEKKLVEAVEIEGELPLLIVNAKHNTGTLWVIDPKEVTEKEIPPTKHYEETDEDGTTAVWQWCNEQGELVIRMAVFNSNQPEVSPAHVVLSTPTSLFTFMTDFKDWVYSECYGNPILDVENYCLEWLKRQTQQEGE